MTTKAIENPLVKMLVERPYAELSRTEKAMLLAIDLHVSACEQEMDNRLDDRIDRVLDGGMPVSDFVARAIAEEMGEAELKLARFEAEATA